MGTIPYLLMVLLALPLGGAKPGRVYWRGAYGDKKAKEQFVNAAHDYFGDGIGGYINGSGDSYASTAGTRQAHGRKLGKEIAENLMKVMNDPDAEKPKEINIVSHSMGAATAEGIIEELMKYPELAALLRQGDVVHLSAADADEIVIASGTEDLRRTQINYIGDETLFYADNSITAVMTGGYQIPGVNRFIAVEPSMEKSHPYYHKIGYKYDWHNETKWYKEPWDFIQAYDKKVKINPEIVGKPYFMEHKDIEYIDSEIEQNKTQESLQNNQG